MSSTRPRLRPVPSPERRYVRNSIFNPVVRLRRLEATYPQMLVDQRYNTMQRNQNFVEAEGEAEAEKKK
jgi:hypothetical protein